MKLTHEQRKLLDDTVLDILRTAPQAFRFASVDTQTRLRLADKIGGEWNFRFTDGALQRLRKAGLIRTKYQKWTSVPRPNTASNTASEHA